MEGFIAKGVGFNVDESARSDERDSEGAPLGAAMYTSLTCLGHLLQEGRCSILIAKSSKMVANIRELTRSL